MSSIPKTSVIPTDKAGDEFDAAFGDAVPAGAKPGEPLAVTMEFLAKLNEDPVVTRFVNAPLGPVTGYDIDHDAGFVRFTNPVGHLRKQGIEAPEMGVLKTVAFEARVRITFAYEDSALAREGALALGAELPADVKGDGAARYHYHALYLRSLSSVSSLTKGLVDPDLAEDERYPLVVTDDTLRLVVPLDDNDGKEGESNLEDLDRRSREIAQSILAGENEVSGEEGEAQVLAPIDPSSVIGRVAWEGGPDGCRTMWTIGISKAAKAKTLAARIAAEATPRPTGGTG